MEGRWLGATVVCRVHHQGYRPKDPQGHRTHLSEALSSAEQGQPTH